MHDPDGMMSVWLLILGFSHAAGTFSDTFASYSRYGWVTSVSYSPDGSRAVSGGYDNKVKVWAVGSDSLSWGLMKVLGQHSKAVTSVAFSPDGTFVVSGGLDRTVKLWSVSGESSQWTLVKDLDAHENDVSRVAFSSDGMCLFSAGLDGVVKVWFGNDADVSKWQLTNGIEKLGGAPIHSIEVSKNSTRMATRNSGGRVSMWIIGTNCSGLSNGEGARIVTVTGLGELPELVQIMALSPDGDRLATGGYDKRLKLWSRQSSVWEVLAVLGEQDDHLDSLVFSPDGTRIVTSSRLHKLQLWFVGGTFKAKWGLLERIAANDQIFSSTFSPDGKRLLTGGYDAVKMWNIGGVDASVGEVLQDLGRHDRPLDLIAIIVACLLVAVGIFLMSVFVLPRTSNRMAVQLADGHKNSSPETWGHLKDLGEHDHGVGSVAFSPDGKCVASGGYDKQVNMWVIDDEQSMPRNLGEHDGWVRCIAFSSDGKYLVSGGLDKKVKIWCVDFVTSANWGFVRDLGEQDGGVEGLAFSPCGKHLVTVGGNNQIMLWFTGDSDVRNWGPLQVIGDHDGPVYSVAFSPSGTRIATGGHDKKIKVWQNGGGISSTSWQFQKDLGEHGGGVECIAFSPDGMKVVSGGGDNFVKLWFIGGAKKAKWGHLTDLGEHDRHVYTVAFAPDGTHVVSGGYDHKVKVWFVGGSQRASWGLVKEINEHDCLIASAAFSPDGSLVVSGGYDRKVRLSTTGSTKNCHNPTSGMIVPPQICDSVGDGRAEVTRSPDVRLRSATPDYRSAQGGS